MKKTLLSGRLLMAIVIICSFGADWRQFRGTSNQNTTSETGLPLEFDQKTGKNIAWTADLPGRGPAGPIVVGDQIFVICSDGHKQDRLHVLAFDKKTGKRNWHQQFWATGHTLYHPMGAIAQPTPASDGKSIFAFYSCNDLACFDLEGNLKWLRGLAYDYPRARIDAGMSSSPLVVGPTVIVQIQNQGESFVSGIDTATGKTRWRIPRKREAIWSSPTILRGESPSYEDDLLLLQDRTTLTAHNPQTGKEVCKYEAQCHTISSATTGSPGGKDKVKMNVYLPALGLHALRANLKTGEFDFLWHAKRMRSSNTSPVIHKGRAYTINSSGVLACGDAASGKVLWQLRLKGPFWATPLVTDTHLYAVNYDGGAVHVVELGEKKGKLLRKCQFDSKILASPVAVDGAIYLRSDQHLMKVALPK